ncbi:MinD/ParA family protein [Nocardiopsis sp. CC223A]|uniref:MinD/ParA family ATP-binding protein n=1 Tax=Nocardiopsis sp. CC223A TaxID=3044051 RepID=UPI00278C3D8D|nr:MinD/ParA family protein [Nocardiopsis sp. CC223A]
MSHQDQNGTDAGFGAEESEVSPWRRAEDEPDEAGAPVTEIASRRPAAPSPREQWFGGDAPPPPPYAAPIPPETPMAPLAPPAAAEADAASGADAGDDDDESGEDEVRSDTVRLMPRVRERPARPLRRPARPEPDDDEADPLAPRDLRRDADVPEPEQLPPLEPGAAADPEPPAPPVADRAPFADPPAAPPVPGPAVPGPPAVPGLPAQGAPLPGVPPTPTAPGVTGERQTSDSLNAATLVRSRHQGPSGGWRRAVHTATLGLINPGESPKVLRRRELIARACTPVATGHHRVAVLSLKGGVGKTTTTVALGATLASLRGDRVLAVDANPDRGTLSDKVRLETAATIRDLLNERHLVSRYADIRGFTSQAPSRLEILASDRDPAVSEAFGDEDYREVARIVEHFYSICITDCGTGLLHAAMRGVLGLADQVVLVSSASVDGARSASATLDWLQAHGHEDLVRDAAVVLSMVRSDSKSSVDLDRLEGHFAARCRAVVRVPWDGHLEEGAEVDLDRLAPATRDAYLRLAATVGEGFARHG